MKKIALINPPSPFLINDKVFPNSGLLQLTTSLKEKGYNARIIDLCGNENPLKKMFNEIQDETHIGFSSTTPQFVDTYKLHKELKKKIPKIKTIIGGAHPSAIYSLMKNGRTEDVNIKPLMEFDHIVVGEGDEIDPFNLQKGWNVQKLIKDINEKPIPDRKLIDILSYEYSLKCKSTPTIVTQRGCPFKCTFCCGIVFFQAEDGIRDWSVTGVQTCALPISSFRAAASSSGSGMYLTWKPSWTT